MEFFWKVFDRGLNIIVSVIYATLTIIAFTQVVVRYVLGGSIPWSEEAVRFLFVWLSFIGFSITMQRGGHIAVDFVVNLFPYSFRRVFLLISDIFVLSFIFFFTIKGASISQGTMLNLSPAMNIPMGYFYLILPLSGILLTVNTVRLAARHWRGPLKVDVTEV